MSSVDADTLMLVVLVGGGLVGMARWASRSRPRVLLVSAAVVLYVLALAVRIHRMR